MQAHRWLELRRAADVIARVPRPLVEVARPQAAFNHALLDLLERWPAVRDAELSRECDRLEALARARPKPPPSHRAGLSGLAITLAKRAALPALTTGLLPLMLKQREQNLGRVAALRRREASTASLRLQDFDALLDRALPEILAVDSYDAEYRAWVEQVEPKLPVPEPSPLKVSIVCEGSPSASWLAALFQQKGTWECIFTEGPVPPDRRFRLGKAASATGEFVLWVSAESELAPQALQSFAVCTDVDLAYADEDRLGRTEPFFKPSFCSELARERDLLGGAVWVRRSAMQGERPLDWALKLPAERIRRVPAVLSHRTTPYVLGTERVKRPVPDGVKVSIVVPFRDKHELLVQLLASVERHPPGVPVEWVFVDNGSRERVESLPGVTLRDDGPFNWSRLNNLGAARATGTHLLFLNNDIEAASPGWLRVLMEYAGIAGVVGANLWYPDGTIQHAGVALGVKGYAGHVFARWREGWTPFGTPLQTRTVSAVTGACLLVSREDFERVRGFDERLAITGGDVELCLRIGKRVLNVPHVKLFHHESLSRSGLALSPENLERERAAYAPFLPDRFYNPNLTRLFTHCGVQTA